MFFFVCGRLRARELTKERLARAEEKRSQTEQRVARCGYLTEYMWNLHRNLRGCRRISILSVSRGGLLLLFGWSAAAAATISCKISIS